MAGSYSAALVEGTFSDWAEQVALAVTALVAETA